MNMYSNRTPRYENYPGLTRNWEEESDKGT